MSEKASMCIGSSITMVLVSIISIGIGFGLRHIIKPTQDGLSEQAPPLDQPIFVEVDTVKPYQLNPTARYIGHVEPIEEVALTAQVAGYISQVAFKEGSLIKKGDLLFQIDEQSYIASTAQRKAELAKAKAEYDRAKRYEERIRRVDARSVTQSDIDTAHATALQSKAAVAKADADLLQAEIDLSRTKIIAPISGRIGTAMAKLGDYVSPGMGTLARIVQVDPIRVVFSITDKDYLQGRKEQLTNNLRARLLLPNGAYYEHEGEMDFWDNEMSISTASLPVRLRFDNADEQLLVNAFVTIIMSHATAPHFLTVPQMSILTNTQGSYVYVVNDDMSITPTSVTLGIAEGKLIAIEGLKEGTRIVTEGVSIVNPSHKVSIIEPKATK